MPHLGYLHDRRDVDRTFKINGGLWFVATTIGSKAPTADVFEAELNSLMDSDRSIVIDLGNGTRKPSSLLVTWEAQSVVGSRNGVHGPTDTIYTLTFREVVMVHGVGSPSWYGGCSCARCMPRRNSDHDLEIATTPLSQLSGPALDALAEQVGAGSRACPECGPHGGKGRVLLLDSWVDCLTCKAAT